MRFLDAGDAAVTVEFGDRVDPALVAQVAALEQAIDAARGRGELPGVIEAMPTFRSLTVLYDPLVTGRAEVDAVLHRLLDHPGTVSAAPGRRWRLPVCYEGEHGVDLADIGNATGLAPQAVAELHAASAFTVYMIGFMPGFPFMGGLPAALNVPRRREPRVRVPAGSVAITGALTAIYPWESPGGWQIVGRCPVPLFDADRSAPSLLAPGDRVEFEAVPARRFAELARAAAAGELAPSAWQVLAA
jgi:KipI family sensor histidine kinase inhibitor